MSLFAAIKAKITRLRRGAVTHIPVERRLSAQAHEEALAHARRLVSQGAWVRPLAQNESADTAPQIGEEPMTAPDAKKD